MRKTLVATTLVFSALAIASCAVDDVGFDSCLTSFVAPQTTDAEVVFQDGLTEIAESFTVPSASAPASILLKLKPVGLPTGTLTVKLEKDSSGQPDGIPVDSGTLDLSTVRVSTTSTTGEAYYKIAFTNPVPPTTLTKGAVYWIRVKGNAALSTATAGPSVKWMGNGESAYAGKGSALSSNNGANFTAGTLGANRAFFYKLGCSE